MRMILAVILIVTAAFALPSAGYGAYGSPPAFHVTTEHHTTGHAGRPSNEPSAHSGGHPFHHMSQERYTLAEAAAILNVSLPRYGSYHASVQGTAADLASEEGMALSHGRSGSHATHENDDFRPDSQERVEEAHLAPATHEHRRPAPEAPSVQVFHERYAHAPQNHVLSRPMTAPYGKIHYNTPGAASTVSAMNKHERTPLRKPDVTILKHEDDHQGNYVYHYKSGDGSQVQATGILKDIDGSKVIVKRGSYSIPGPDNKLLTVHWVADEFGYRAFGDHLPTPHPAPEYLHRSTDRRND